MIGRARFPGDPVPLARLSMEKYLRGIATTVRFYLSKLRFGKCGRQAELEIRLQLAVESFAEISAEAKCKRAFTGLEEVGEHLNTIRHQRARAPRAVPQYDLLEVSSNQGLGTFAPLGDPSVDISARQSFGRPVRRDKCCMD